MGEGKLEEGGEGCMAAAAAAVDKEGGDEEGEENLGESRAPAAEDVGEEMKPWRIMAETSPDFRRLSAAAMSARERERERERWVGEGWT